MKKTLLNFSLLALSALVFFFACKKHDNGASNCPYRLTVTGTAQTCSDILKSGSVSIQLDGNTYKGTVTNGNFSVTVPRCSFAQTQVKVIVTDPATGYSSDQTPYDSTNYLADTGILAIALPLDACKQDQWITSSASRGVYSLPDAISYTSTSIGGSGINNVSPFINIYIQVATPFNGPGNYAITQFAASQSSSPVYIGGKYGGTVTVTSFGSVGGYVTGTYTVQTHDGTVDTSTTDLYTVTGDFQVKRTQ